MASAQWGEGERMKGSPGGNYRNGIANERGKRRKIQTTVRGVNRNIKKGSRKEVGKEVGKEKKEEKYKP